MLTPSAAASPPAPSSPVAASQEDEIFWVRLKPYNLRKGFVMRRYVVFGLRFDEERGWYKVPRFVAKFKNKNPKLNTQVDLIEYLRTIRQLSHNPESPDAFDICTEEEARAMDTAEKQAKRLRASAVDPASLGQDLTVSDLANGSDQGDDDEEDLAAPAPKPGRSVRAARSKK